MRWIISGIIMLCTLTIIEFCFLSVTLYSAIILFAFNCAAVFTFILFLMSLCKVLKLVKNNYRNIVKYLGSRLLTVILFFLILVIVKFIQESDAVYELLLNLLTAIITFVLFSDLLTGIYRLFIYQENIRLSNKKYKYRKSLYNWTEDAALEDGVLHRILSETNANMDTINNLRQLKNDIEKYCKKDLLSLRLLKIHVERCIKITNIFSKKNVIFTTIITGLVSLMISNFDNLKGYFMTIANFAVGQEGQDPIKLFDMLINGAFFVLMTWSMLFFIWRILTRNRHRLTLIDKVLELSILEEAEREGRKARILLTK